MGIADDIIVDSGDQAPEVAATTGTHPLYPWLKTPEAPEAPLPNKIRRRVQLPQEGEAGIQAGATGIAGDTIVEDYPDRPWPEYVEGATGELVKGVVDIPKAVYGVPLTAMGKILEGITGHKDFGDPVFGYQHFERLQKQVDEMFPMPEGPGGDALAVIARLVGSTATMSGVLVGLAGKAPILLDQASKAKLWPNIGRTLLEPYAKTPAIAAAVDAISAASAGAGGALAKQVFPESRTAELSGELVGGLLPMLTPTALAIRAALWAKGKIAPKAIAKVMGGRAKRTLGAAVEGKEAEFALGEQLKRDIPGFDPTVGEVTGSRVAIKQQIDIEGRAVGQDLKKFVTRAGKNQAAIKDYLGRQVPDSGTAPNAVIDSVSGKIDDALGKIGTATKGLMAEKMALGQKFERQNIREIGKSLRGSFLRLEKNARSQYDKTIKKSGASEHDVTDAFKAWFKDINTDPDIGFDIWMRRYSDYPPSFGKIDALLRRIKPKKGKKVPLIQTYRKDLGIPLVEQQGPREGIKFSDLVDLHKWLGKDLRSTMTGANPDHTRARSLSITMEKLDNLMGNADKEARNLYVEMVVKPFYDQTAWKVKERTGTGQLKTYEERIAGLFVRAGKPEYARQFRATYGADPEAQQAIYAELLDRFRLEALTPEGYIDPKKMQGFLNDKRYGRILDEFPDIQKVFLDTATAEAGLGVRIAELAGRQQEIQQSALAKAIAKATHGDINPENVIDNAIKIPSQMNELINKWVGRDKTSMAGLREYVWGKAIRTGSAEGIDNFLNENLKSMQQVFSPRHLKALRNAVKAYTMIERVNPPSGQPIVPQPGSKIEGLMGMKIPQALSRVWSLFSRRVPRYYAASEAGLRVGRAAVMRNFDKSMIDVLYDPQVAILIDEALFTGAKVVLPSPLFTRLMSLGIAPLRENEEITLSPEEITMETD